MVDFWLRGYEFPTSLHMVESMVPTLGCTLTLGCTSKIVIQVVWWMGRVGNCKIFKEILRWYLEVGLRLKVDSMVPNTREHPDVVSSIPHGIPLPDSIHASSQLPWLSRLQWPVLLQSQWQLSWSWSCLSETLEETALGYFRACLLALAVGPFADTQSSQGPGREGNKLLWAGSPAYTVPRSWAFWRI